MNTMFIHIDNLAPVVIC